MVLVIMGIVSAFNLLIIKWKFEHGRTLDGVLDLASFVVICYLFSASTEALFVGMVASMVVSVYLLISPPKVLSHA